MKALILAGGRGRRLKEVTNECNKSMYNFHKQPLIEYSLNNSIRAGVDEIIVVVSYKAEQIINRYGNKFNGTPIKYVIQWERKGVVHAIECSRETIEGSNFMLFLADEILIDPKHKEFFTFFNTEELFASCGVVWVNKIDRIKNTYSVIYDENSQRIYRLIEKPKNPFNQMMGTGNCVFKNEIFDYIESTPINQQRKEKELPDMIQCAIDDGKPVKFFDIGGDYINVNNNQDLMHLELISS
ncbi:nucleotidyltransferase family protein [Desulfobacula sp.]|uniref:nucleotidyltransferase family protein n=1 Tax=Desulfobacula sp. TaxID=2593537 RepID=UPI002633C409|nr:nucleotidyltransferase family protein [Desulfobacula sp.]